MNSISKLLRIRRSADWEKITNYRITQENEHGVLFRLQRARRFSTVYLFNFILNLYLKLE